MPSYQWILIAVAVTALVWAAAVALLVISGRRTEARAMARFIPDCLVLARRLLADSRIPRRRKLILVALLAYLAMPIDLVPDFIPVAGQLDDVIIVALAMRYVLRFAGPAMIAELWPGPPESLAIVRLAWGAEKRPT